MSQQNNGREPGPFERADFRADTNQLNDILPDCPAANKLSSFVTEILPTPLREPASVVQILIRFDAKNPLPDDWAVTVASTISGAKNRALIADCMTPGANAFWAGCK